MKRGLFNVAAGVSLMIGMTALALWPLSYFKDMEFNVSQVTPLQGLHFPEMNLDGFGTECGYFSFHHLRSADQATALLPHQFDCVLMNASQTDYSGGLLPGWLYRIGIPMWEREVFTPSSTGYAVNVPCWIILLMSVPLPYLWARRHRRTLVANANCCRGCGYDLRGSPASGACPECGAIPLAKT